MILVAPVLHTCSVDAAGILISVVQGTPDHITKVDFFCLFLLRGGDAIAIIWEHTFHPVVDSSATAVAGRVPRADD